MTDPIQALIEEFRPHIVNAVTFGGDLIIEEELRRFVEAALAQSAPAKPEPSWFYIEPVDSADMSKGEQRVEMSEIEIVAACFPYWSGEMRKAGKDESLITARNCIEDWVVVNWAQRVVHGEP